MRETAVAVRCVYQDGGKTAGELLESSFRLYLRRLLAAEREG